MPAAHQRSAIWPFCQCLTLRQWVRTMEIIDSMLLVRGLLHRWRARSGQAEMMRPCSIRVSASRSSFAGFRFPPEVITLAVRWYLRFGQSYRDGVGLENSMQRPDLRSCVLAGRG
jgi:hypothetical protein